MGNRYLASALGLVLAAVFAAGGTVCSGKTGTPCSCCLAAGDSHRSPAAAPCCTAACRKAPSSSPTGPTESAANGTTQEPPAPPVAPDHGVRRESALVPVALKTAALAVAQHHPPDLFVQKAAFLI